MSVSEIDILLGEMDEEFSIVEMMVGPMDSTLDMMETTPHQEFCDVNLPTHLPRELELPQLDFNQIFTQGDNEVYVRDLRALRKALETLKLDIIKEIVGTKSHMDGTVTYDDDDVFLKKFAFCDDRLFSPDGMTHEHLIRAGEILYARLIVSLNSEKPLLKKEAQLVSGTKAMKLDGSLLRANRAFYRNGFNSVVADLQTGPLRPIFLIPRSEKTVGYVVRPYNESDECCAICSEGFPQNQDAPAVTYTCCSHPFHVSCLLEWVMINVKTGVTCPMCRANLQSRRFIGELMEMRVQQMRVL